MTSIRLNGHGWQDGADQGKQVTVWAYNTIRTQILSGRYDPGSWLRAEALATQLGVSRTPVREAFRQLHADGLIELIPNRGAQVTQFSEEYLAAIYELRVLLEGYGARGAAEGARVDIGYLRKLCVSMEDRLREGAAQAFDEITRENILLHEHIHQASGNAALPTLLSGIVGVPLVLRTFHHYTAGELARSFAQHREIVDAIEAGDGGWAEAVMRSHILAARNTLQREIVQNTSLGEDTSHGDRERTPS